MPAKEVPAGNEEFANFKNTMRKLLSVSKAELDQIRKEEAAKKKAAKAKKRSS
jgi:hypothetical protein